MTAYPVAVDDKRVMRYSKAVQQGFTLIEMMVALVVMAILLAVAVPSFQEVALGTKLSTYSSDLVASVHLARSEAIKRNAVVSLCASTDGATCNGASWEGGWIVLSGTSVLQVHEAASAGIKLNGTAVNLDFQPSGVGVTSATVTICRYQPSVGSRERVVSISTTGRTSVAKTSNGACA